MSYNDPYASGQHAQQYQDAPFNPYEVQQQQQHATGNYGQGTYDGYGYTDADVSGRAKERSTFDDEPVPVPPIGEKTPRNMRQWRSDYQGNLWTKGSRASCFGRFFCCTIMIFLFLLISIVLSLALWLRPPNIIIGEPTPDLSTFSANTSTFSIALPVDVSVNNPNYFTVELSSLDATVIYPINNTQVGSGDMKDIKFQDHTQTNFTFPVTLEYNTADDPDGDVLSDLLTKCTSNSDVSVTVDIKVSVKIMLIPISTTITKPVSFACTLGNELSELENILKEFGQSGLASLLS